MNDKPHSDTKVYHVEEIFMKGSTENELVKIRKRGLNQVYSYYKETKGRGQGRKVEIDAVQYEQLRQNRDEGLKVVTKKRICFLYDSVSFIIDDLEFRGQDIQILRIEGLERDIGVENIKIPGFIKIIREITD